MGVGILSGTCATTTTREGGFANGNRSDPTCAPQIFYLGRTYRLAGLAPSCGTELWHDRGVLAFARILLQLLADVVSLAGLALRPRRSLEAENLFRRRELALYQERGVKPRRVDAAARVSLALLSRLFDWRDALVAVRPEILIRWHRAGWRHFWRYSSRPGCPPIAPELRQLIRRMATENPLWGEERIANELLLKLGLRVSPRTVRKYMPKRPAGRPRDDQRWSTFLRNHARPTLACDFFVALTASFRLFYVLVLIEHGSRGLVHFSITQPPTADWTLQQLQGGGHRLRRRLPISSPRPRWHLRHELGRVDQESRADGAHVAAAQPEGQCDLRTGDRNDWT